MVRNIVFIAKSLDGYIADKNGGLDWLNAIPNPDKVDMGYTYLIESIDALIMGRITFNVVCDFDLDWPYVKPVFVLSNTLKSIPENLNGKVQIINGSLANVLQKIHSMGYKQLYVDGGATIQSFLREDLIDEMVITTIPILLGGGIPLFGDLPSPIDFTHKKSEVFLNAIVQDTYQRKRKKHSF